MSLAAAELSTRAAPLLRMALPAKEAACPRRCRRSRRSARCAPAMAIGSGMRSSVLLLPLPCDKPCPAACAVHTIDNVIMSQAAYTYAMGLVHVTGERVLGVADGHHHPGLARVGGGREVGGI
jgi:hypothetical protein